MIEYKIGDRVIINRDIYVFNDKNERMLILKDTKGVFIKYLGALPPQYTTHPTLYEVFFEELGLKYNISSTIVEVDKEYYRDKNINSILGA